MSQIKQTKEPKATIKDVLVAINIFSTEVEKRFVNIENKMVTKQELKKELGKINGEIGHIKTHMVTKEYLDDKLSDLKGDFVGLIRKEDDKVVMLVEELHTTKVISSKSTERILALEPFPKVQRS